MARLDRKLMVTWTELKALAAKKYLGFHSYETLNATEVYLIEDGKPSFWAAVFKDNDERYDADERAEWETTYAPTANGPSKPRSRDGRDKTQPVTVDAGQWHNWHGVGDSATTLRAGQFMAVRLWWEGAEGSRVQKYQTIVDDAISAAADVTESTFKMRWGYRDPVWLAGGRLKYQGACFGDAVSMRVVAPAAALTPNGGNTGNCVVMSGVVIPTAGNGTHDVDLDSAAPVPAPTSNGFWEYEIAANVMGRGVVSVSQTPGTAPYLLFAADFALTEFISQDPLLGDGQYDYDPSNINASLCLPEYVFECEVRRLDPGTDAKLELVWRVLDTRYWTTV